MNLLRVDPCLEDALMHFSSLVHEKVFDGSHALIDLGGEGDGLGGGIDSHVAQSQFVRRGAGLQAENESDEANQAASPIA